MIIWERYNKYYSISSEGDIRTVFRGNKTLKGLIKSDGYKMYFLKMEDGKSKWRYAHRLVAELFVLNPDNLPEVNHKDRNKLNNNHTNLEYITHAANIEHSYLNGRVAPSGKGHYAYGKTASEETRMKMSEKRRDYWRNRRKNTAQKK